MTPYPSFRWAAGATVWPDAILVRTQLGGSDFMGNIQVISRGSQWVVIQRGDLNDLSLHMSLDEAISAARDIAARKRVKFVPPPQVAAQAR